MFRPVLRRSYEFTVFNAKGVLDSILNSYTDYQPTFLHQNKPIGQMEAHLLLRKSQEIH